MPNASPVKPSKLDCSGVERGCTLQFFLLSTTQMGAVMWLKAH